MTAEEWSLKLNQVPAMPPFAVMFLLAGITLVVIGRKLERKAKLSASWPVTAGLLERCEVVEVPGIQVGDTSSWQLQIRYSYVVQRIHRTQ